MCPRSKCGQLIPSSPRTVSVCCSRDFVQQSKTLAECNEKIIKWERRTIILDLFNVVRICTLSYQINIADRKLYHLDNFKIQFKIYVCFVGSDFFPKIFFVLVIFWHEKNWLWFLARLKKFKNIQRTLALSFQKHQNTVC